MVKSDLKNGKKNRNWKLLRNKTCLQQYIKTMRKLVSNRNSLFACLADCPMDNHARQLAQFLYETLGNI